MCSWWTICSPLRYIDPPVVKIPQLFFGKLKVFLYAQPHRAPTLEHGLRPLVDVRSGLRSEAELRQILENFFRDRT